MAAEHGIVRQTFVEVRSRLLCISEEVLLGWTWLERFTTIEILLILFFLYTKFRRKKIVFSQKYEGFL